MKLFEKNRQRMRDYLIALRRYGNWQSVLCAKLFGTKNGFLEVNFKKENIICKMFKDNSIITLYREIFVDDKYRLCKISLPDKAVLIDIGAHIGMFSLYAYSRLKGCAIFAYEPNEELFSLLEENILRNNADNIKSFNKAVLGESKNIVYVKNKIREMGYVDFHQKISESSLSVQAITIKDIFYNNNILECDFMKIDCEGSEYDILFNAPKEILNRIHNISMEVHDVNHEHSIQGMTDFLNDNNYDVHKDGHFILAKNRNA